MSRTYHAVLLGDHLEWKGNSPAVAKPTEVEVTVPEPGETLSSEERRRRAAAALEELAAGGGIDYQAWVESRAERPLAGRDE